MKNKTLIYNMAMKEVVNLKLDGYHTVFLANMVLRKIRHPEEKMDKIASKTMKKMRELSEKKNLIEVSASKCLNQLEEALNDSKAVPDEWLAGQSVSNVVKKLVEKVVNVLDDLSEEE